MAPLCGVDPTWNCSDPVRIWFKKRKRLVSDSKLMPPAKRRLVLSLGDGKFLFRSLIFPSVLFLFGDLILWLAIVIMNCRERREWNNESNRR